MKLHGNAALSWQGRRHLAKRLASRPRRWDRWHEDPGSFGAGRARFPARRASRRPKSPGRAAAVAVTSANRNTVDAETAPRLILSGGQERRRNALRPVVEAEDLEAAVQPVARGIGDTLIPARRSARFVVPGRCTHRCVRLSTLGDVRLRRVPGPPSHWRRASSSNSSNALPS